MAETTRDDRSQTLRQALEAGDTARVAEILGLYCNMAQDHGSVSLGIVSQRALLWLQSNEADCTPESLNSLLGDVFSELQRTEWRFERESGSQPSPN